MEGMHQSKQNNAKRRPMKREGQLMLNLSGAHQLQSLPEPNRSQCIALLGRMLLGAIEASHREEKSSPNQNSQSQP